MDLSAELASAIVYGGCRGRAPLTALYDERCALCGRLKAWLAGQATLVPIEFLAAGSPAARARYPSLDHERTTRVLTVVATDGAVYEGERAWLVCAWALPAWQPVAEQLAGRGRLPLVRVFSRSVDWYRHRLLRASYGTTCGSCRTTAPRA